MELYLRFENFKAKTFTVSYDDNRHPVIPFSKLMKKYGIRGTFNLNSGYFPPRRDAGEFFTKEQARQALCDESGCFEIAVHGVTHPFLEKLEPADVEYEIAEDIRALEEVFGVRVRGMAYPYGTYSEQVIEIAKKCGILYSRTCDATHDFSLPKDWLRLPATCHHNYDGLPALTERFVKETPVGDPFHFYVWGHANEFDYHNNWYVAEDLFKAISDAKDQVWMATNMEIYEAVKSFEALEINGNEITNPTDKTVWFVANGENIKLMPGEKAVVKGE